jgi:hypothetical protein
MRRRLVIVVLAVPLLSLVAACSRSDGTSASRAPQPHAAQRTPRIAETDNSAEARPAPSGLPRCRARELTARVSDYNGLTGGFATAYVLVRDVGRRDCVVHGSPRFIAFGSHHQPVRLHPSDIDGGFDRHKPQPIALAHAGSDFQVRESAVPISVAGLAPGLARCPRHAYDTFRPLVMYLPHGGPLHIRPGAVNNRLGTCEGQIHTGHFQLGLPYAGSP